jgi:chemotaxis protein MotB
VNLLALKAEQHRAERAKLESLKQKLTEMVAANPKLTASKGQIKMDMTRDGLRIQIIDENNRPMFDSGSAIVKPYMRDLLRAIGEVLAEVPNRLTLEGHTDAQKFSSGDWGYSNWELSSDRANASRRELLTGGLPEGRVLRVVGLAHSLPLLPSEPNHPTNRRISLIVMTKEAEERIFRTNPDTPDSPDEPNLSSISSGSTR